MANDFSLFKFDGDSTGPFFKLVQRFFDPMYVRKMAQAKADADMVLLDSEIELNEKRNRTFNRFMQEEEKKQTNIDNILLEAGPMLNDNAKPEDIENDWIANANEKMKNVSEKDMRNLWAKLLAGEANQPLSFSKRTVNFVGDLEKSDAELFTKFCSFTIQSGGFLPVIYKHTDNVYNSNGIYFDTLEHLDAIGLIKFQHISNFQKMGHPKTVNWFYFGKPFLIEYKNETDNKFNFGHANLTKIGNELAPIGLSPKGNLPPIMALFCSACC